MSKERTNFMGAMQDNIELILNSLQLFAKGVRRTWQYGHVNRNAKRKGKFHGCQDNIELLLNSLQLFVKGVVIQY